MSTFRVRASSLGEVSAQLQGVIAVFDGHVASVAAKVNAVSGVSWEGDDQRAFAERFSQWQQTADLVRLSLTTLSMQLAAAEGGYTQTESSIQGGFAQRRQENTTVVKTVEEVDEAVDTGLERARTRVKAETGKASAGGAVTARSGQGQSRDAGSAPQVPAAAATVSSGDAS